jgi:hypothetical protein
MSTIPEGILAGAIEGDGWTLTLTEGWRLVPSARAGDFTVVRDR